MRNLTIGDLKLALRNLLGDRKPSLLLSGAGKLYEKQLSSRLAEIEKLPEALTGGKPLAAELDEVDDSHDGLGEAIYYYCESVQRLPIASPDLKASAQRIRDAFVPRLGVLRDSYADEAAAATKNRQSLIERKADLEAFPVSTPQGGTLLDWATAFVDHGDKLDKLLDQRALASSGMMPVQVIKLRTTTIGMLGRLRAALADEMASDESLPRDLDARVFSHLDELQSMRVAQARAAKRSKRDDGKDGSSPAGG